MSNYQKQTSDFSTNAIHVPYEADRSRAAVVPPITTSVIFRQELPETGEVGIENYRQDMQ